MRPHPGRTGALLAGILLVSIVAPSVVRGVNTLSGGSVTPPSGTTNTTFRFTVDYTSTNGQEATRVWASVAGDTVILTLLNGTPDDGTFRGSASLPAGSWPVTFEAISQGVDPTDLPGPTVVVTAPPTPQPTPSPPPPTPVPTANPTPIPTATVSPGASAPAATRRPTPRATPRPSSGTAPPPGTTAAPTATSAVGTSPTASPAAASGTPLPGAATRLPRGSGSNAGIVASPSASAEPTDARTGIAAGPGPLLVLGGSLAAAGVGVLVVQLMGWRRRRRLPSTGAARRDP